MRATETATGEQNQLPRLSRAQLRRRRAEDRRARGYRPSRACYRRRDVAVWRIEQRLWAKLRARGIDPSWAGWDQLRDVDGRAADVLLGAAGDPENVVGDWRCSMRRPLLAKLDDQLRVDQLDQLLRRLARVGSLQLSTDPPDVVQLRDQLLQLATAAPHGPDFAALERS